ncbi:MAG: hypothetical protein P4M15_13460 [Alphaproteobacteria bacterium]|nr:hypothetical protein [Alphaproteobacteria bacterium]
MKALALLLALCACAEAPVLKPVEVDVPVPVMCWAAPVARPDFPVLDARADLFIKTRGLLKELTLRKAYEAALEAALHSCPEEKL